jgi:UDP-glucose 4-epimerase
LIKVKSSHPSGDHPQGENKNTARFPRLCNFLPFFMPHFMDQLTKQAGTWIVEDGSTRVAVLDTATYTALAESLVPGSTSQTVLVTGGAGYIGSHVVRQLRSNGYDVVVLDNLSTGSPENLVPEVPFVNGSVGDRGLLEELFRTYPINVVIHLAASLEVEESVRFPGLYFENNVLNTATLLSVMDEHNVSNIIFASTAAVYGVPKQVPIPESAPLHPNNPYGTTKLLGEKLIKYFCEYRGFRGVALRFFNACGFDPSSRIIDGHKSHLIPIVLDVLYGRQAVLTINGNDYDTVDGTCVRDYVHVLDIARAHLAALDKLPSQNGFEVYNIGTNRGSSVKEIIDGVMESTGKMVSIEMGPRRPGDAPITVADNTKITRELGFDLRYSDLNTIIATSLNAY